MRRLTWLSLLLLAMQRTRPSICLSQAPLPWNRGIAALPPAKFDMACSKLSAYRPGQILPQACPEAV